MKSFNVPRLLFVLVLTVVLPACSRGDDLITMRVGDHEFRIEIAATAEERERGLMHREELGPDEGMLFVFPDSALRSFWMKNTIIPLSIAYISQEGRILEIHDMEPLSLSPVRSRFPARYALELNQGRFDELGITVGDRIQLEVLPREIRR